VIYLDCWVGTVIGILGAILFTAGFLMRRDQLQRRDMENMQHYYERILSFYQPSVQDAIDEEDAAIERARVYLSWKGNDHDVA
jgi:hypothetical protein